MTAPSAGQIAAMLNARIADLARDLLGEHNRPLSNPSQLRFGTTGSMAVEIAGEHAGQWFDHELGVGGDGLELIKSRHGVANGDALDQARQWLGLPAYSFPQPAPPRPPSPSSAPPSPPPPSSTLDNAPNDTPVGALDETMPQPDADVEGHSASTSPCSEELGPPPSGLLADWADEHNPGNTPSSQNKAAETKTEATQPAERVASIV